MALTSRYPPRTLNSTRARQGRLGRHVFWVLLVSTILAALALFGAWTWRADELARVDPTHHEEAVQAKTFDAPAPVARQQ
jgi:hypothetical protein